MKKLVLSFVFSIFSVFAFAQGTWKVDPMHSSVNFNIKHMGISFVQGRFDKFDGTVVTASQDLNNAKFNFTVNVASINTGVEMRDNHLKATDFFDAVKFPTMKFESVSIKKGKNNAYSLTGNLTVKDVTKKVTIPVTFGGVSKNQQGKEVLGFQAKFSIDRLAYGIQYDPTGTGVGKNVDIALYFEVVK